MIEKRINAVARDRWFWLWFYVAIGLVGAAVWLDIAPVLGDVLFFGGLVLFVGTIIWFGKKHWKAGQK